MLKSRQLFASWVNPPWWYALVTLPWLIGVALDASQARRHRGIASREQTTIGAITAHNPSNHDSYQYTYSVGSRTIRGWQIPYRVEWRMGEQVIVYYDPTEPAVSSLVEFRDLSDEDIRSVPITVFGIIGILAYISYRRYRIARLEHTS